MNAPEGIFEETEFGGFPLKDLGKVIEVDGRDHVITAHGARPLAEVIRLIEKGELFLPLTSQAPHPLLREASLRAQTSRFSAQLIGAASLNPHYRTGTRHK